MIAGIQAYRIKKTDEINALQLSITQRELDNMSKQIVVHNIEELDKYKNTILDNLNNSVNMLQQVLNNNDALDAFKIFKFEKMAKEPLSGNQENLIEVINQAHTYLISIMAVEYLYKLYPTQVFIINWGNIPGYDIESLDGAIIAECFAATSYKSNGKLTADLKRLSGNTEAEHKYEFFYDKDFTEKHAEYYKEQYSDIKIVKFKDIK